MPGPKQRRRRRRGPADYAGQPKKKLPFPLGLIFNVKAFYFVFIVVMIVSMAAVGLSRNSSANQVQAPSPIDLTQTPVISAAPINFSSPAPVIDGSKPFVATLKTNKGDITVKLATDTPQTVNSFAFLAAKGFYNGTAFFYIDHAFWAQAGDPACRLDAKTTCTGTSDGGYKLPIEGSALKHVKYALVAPVVQGGTQVSGGQFRILLADDVSRGLDGTETVFGTVTGGQDILNNAADFRLCTALTQAVPNCDTGLTNALIIQSVTVVPGS